MLSIAAVNKNAMSACINLQDDGSCSDYNNRPSVCREYRPDEVCVLISTLDKNDKIRVLASIYGEM